jgi:dTDP-4-dehydrorhamnose 3,5-epimerase
LRGLHYQAAPEGEDKLVRCVSGAIFDVVLDLRASSPTFGEWVGRELSAQKMSLMYVPKGCAHGFITLLPETELIYLASASYAGTQERIIRWNDPKFRIDWPMRPAVLSEKDAAAPDYGHDTHLSGY